MGQDVERLKKVVLRKLQEFNLIRSNTNITLTPNYRFILRGKSYFHYIITCNNLSMKFFLKVDKGNDNAIHCNSFLEPFRDPDNEYIFPVILVPPFEFEAVKYYITTFFEGLNLDIVSKTLEKKDWIKISTELNEQLTLLSTIHSQLYSENNIFLESGCADILKEKLNKRLSHPAFSIYQQKHIYNAYNRCCEILEESDFSRPTLLHMDVKPANIIYNNATGAVQLVDFELARFGDRDFGWTQILLTKCNSFCQEYKSFMYPLLVEGHIKLKEAVDIAKYRCYIFYQTACNIIYYFDRNKECPIEMKKYFIEMLNKLSRE